MYMSCHQLYLFSPHQRIQVNIRFSSHVLLFPCRYDTRLYSSCACQISTLRVFKFCDGFYYASLQLYNFSKKGRHKIRQTCKFRMTSFIYFRQNSVFRLPPDSRVRFFYFLADKTQGYIPRAHARFLTLPRVFKFFLFLQRQLKRS